MFSSLFALGIAWTPFRVGGFKIDEVRVLPPFTAPVHLDSIEAATSISELDALIDHTRRIQR